MPRAIAMRRDRVQHRLIRRKRKKTRRPVAGRTLRFEPLEARQMLSSFAVGEYVRVNGPLNVRTWYGTSQPEISDPDYPSEAPGGTVGRVLEGPQTADGYTWYKVDYGAGAYTGWSSDHRLESSTARVAGTDVSKWQGVVDWPQVYASGHQFAFAKATGGDDPANDDPRFTANATGGRAAGVLVGAYHFAYPDLNPALTGPDSAESEALQFVSVVRPYLTQGYMRPALDLERGSGLGKAALSAWVRTWLETVKSQTGVEPVIYANSNYANNYLDSSLNTYDLWLAHWTYDLQVAPNDGVWNGWSFWQYSGDHYPPPSGTGAARIPGINARALPDVFNGDRARLVSEFAIPAPPAPEITVLGNGVAIADGDATPSTADHTDFGTVMAGQAGPERTYTVRNDGTAALTLGPVTVPSGYTLVEGLVGSLAPGASDALTVRLNTATAGTFAGDVRFTNGDGDESPFNFRITGTVDAPPSADVLDVTPDPRTTAVDKIAILFSETVTGFNLADLSLARDGGGNLLPQSGATLTTSDNVAWELGNLSTLTGKAGSYLLTLTAAGSGIADLSGYALAGDASDAWETDGTIAGRSLFYNHSKFDGNDPAVNAADDNAIAPGKEPLLPGAGMAAFKNYTTFSRGINGIMVDVAGLPVSTLTAADFTFRYGNDDAPGAWPAAADPTTIAVRAGAGTGGSDRVTLVWADNAIPNGNWLQVTVLANDHTGLAANDVFYFGSAIGETGNSTTDAKVNSQDVTRIRNNYTGFGTVGIESVYDFNRDRKVNSQDVTICRNYYSGFTPLRLITPPAAAPSPTSAPALLAKAIVPDAVLTQPGAGWDASVYLDLAWVDQVLRPKPKNPASDGAGVPRGLVDWVLAGYAV